MILFLYKDECTARFSYLHECTFNIYKAHLKRHFKDTLQLKILRKWINIRANSSLGEYHETKMGERTQKTISYTNAWACFMKNISLIALFFFSQANLDFKFNLALIE